MIIKILSDLRGKCVAVGMAKKSNPYPPAKGAIKVRVSFSLRMDSLVARVPLI